MARDNPPAQPSSDSGAINSLVPANETPQANQPTSSESALADKPPENSTNRASWYSRTWPRKPASITQVARESTSSANNAASEVVSPVKLSAKPKTKRSPPLQLTLGKAKSSRGSPADATTTRVNAVSRESISSPSKSKFKSESVAQRQPENNLAQDPSSKAPSAGNGTDDCSRDSDPPESSNSVDEELSRNEIKSTSANVNGGPGWLTWFSRSTAEPQKVSNSAPPSLRGPDPPLPPQDLYQTPQMLATNTMELPPAPGNSSSTRPKRNWLQMWTGGATQEESSIIEHGNVGSSNRADDKKLEAVQCSTKSSATSGSQVPPAEPSAPPTLPGDSSRSSGWVFWSRDRKADSSSTASNEPHVGEIAISDTPSQKRPRRTSIAIDNTKLVRLSKEPETPVSKGTISAKAKGTILPQPKDNGRNTPTESTSETQKDGKVTPTLAKLPPRDARASKQLQNSLPNLLLPSLAETFPPQASPSLLQLLGRLFRYTGSSEERHLHRVREAPKLKSALAIGVHGYFPAPLIRTVLGQPTGTSIKFADMAAKAIRKWTESRGYNCEVKTAALEGEGRIAERVDLLWKLLLNWIDEIRRADFVMIACHSQGVPVAVMLVAKLVSFGCVNSAKVGICAMAGVSLGPFPDYKSRWISGSAGELFDFSQSSSVVSKDYLAALDTVLNFGVRVVYMGSIDDQLVSLESSTFCPVSHPHIYRAVFVDGRIHAPNFLVHLVGFALKLRNLGVPDHGLIRELSGPLAGSLYTGEGHSRIYEENAVYDLVVEFTLETNAISNTPLRQKPRPTASSNPYILPWALRGILEEEFVKSDLHDEANQLLKQFDDWDPTTKVLKDVKFRLEGIRSKL